MNYIFKRLHLQCWQCSECTCLWRFIGRYDNTVSNYFFLVKLLFAGLKMRRLSMITTFCSKCCWLSMTTTFAAYLQKRCSEGMQQIYRRTPMPKCDFNKVAKQLYWNHPSAWVFSYKFAAYLQNTFSQELLWGTASVNSNQFFRSYATFFLKALIPYKNDLKHAVTVPSHWRNYLVFIYSCINFYCPTLRGAWVMWALLFHVTKK